MNEMPGVEISPDRATVHWAVISVCKKMGIDPWKPMSAKDYAQFSAEFEQAIYDSASLRTEAQKPASFEFVAREHCWQGVPVVNGHKILTAESITIDIPATRELPKVTMRLIVADALKTVLGEAKVEVHDETREALISLGWTPPAEAGS